MVQQANYSSVRLLDGTPFMYQQVVGGVEHALDQGGGRVTRAVVGGIAAIASSPLWEWASAPCSATKWPPRPA